ncbi:MULTISPECIES: WD40/YVTN/BNR-like repeat-containing protein [Sphingobacterium]|uniref:WD40/YVTN/BNR-like repeat-containing protein n=1 Tax=Sphingobacterium TaxID=28453 RepID=UPI0008A5515A|nr:MULTISPECIES: YCF48-related protein [Sphingobacterium]OFV17476.1 oxidoreductase [Sphingobacterium sp. HMSC13C05]HAU51881.1 oxidoreductase [Sphingobacterium sp.]HCX56484.1 oxidoreductase [Sphingobacterium sp.]
MKPLFLIFITHILFLGHLNAQQATINLVNQERNSSYRGLSVVDDTTVWVSGSNGTVGLSTDAGKNWQWVNPIGYEKTDFRDIEAFDEHEALIISAGSPAIILSTQDGGRSWKEVFNDKRPEIFYDGFAFTSKGVGIAFGDAIQGKMPLLKSTDFGRSWKDISPNMHFTITDGEAGFAASGTSIYCDNSGTYWIATGGTVSNIYSSKDQGNTWQRYSCPIIQGTNSTGPFSVAFNTSKTGIVVGGDYKADKNKDKNSLLTNDGGKTWSAPQTAPAGFKSAVIYLSKKQLISTGTSGTDLSNDGGKNWTPIGKESFNAVQKAKKGRAIFLVGDKGKIANLAL